MDKEYRNKENNVDKKGLRRSPYSDMGLVLAVSLFVTMVVKGLIFGFTWNGIVLAIIACAYFIIYAVMRSRKKTMKITTTVFIILSALSVWAEFSSRKNVRPKMPVFHGMASDTTDLEEEELDIFAEPVPIVQENITTDTIQNESEPEEIQEENMVPETEETDSIEK
ncbi:MAG: hypothetical protein NC206_02785 [Bacteroides sp.]|nr:hypothetical protein [Roseburia sp.]MCM1345989.1 hypothetical protein [Bacteroides sp.]MCM1420852.1 hypothetical protein [Bacteroides sp.]